MNFKQKIAMLMTVLATTQIPLTGYAAEEDKELAMIAAEQERSAEDENLSEINPLLTDSITTDPIDETDKDRKERKKKLEQTRKDKEKENKRKLKELSDKKDKDKRETETIIIDTNDVPKYQPIQQSQTEIQSKTETPTRIETPSTIQSTPIESIQRQAATIREPVTANNNIMPTPKAVETEEIPNQKVAYSNFAEAARAVNFVPLYMPHKSGYEIVNVLVEGNVVEIQYGRRWEPNVSLTVRTYKRTEGEELQDISGVTAAKWRMDDSTGTSVYLSKISEVEQVAAWAVGHYTFSAHSKNLSFAGFHSLVADELVDLSTHYYLDL
ncbi:MAG: hypothetical protein K6G55_03520 [Selenomonadaceae bacterium]|nr:hypothetical protein [Selenomonadaceae bacterium]